MAVYGPVCHPQNIHVGPCNILEVTNTNSLFSIISFHQTQSLTFLLQLPAGLPKITILV